MKDKVEENEKGKKFVFDGNNQFSGIINYLRNQSNNNIENELNITASSVNGFYDPINVVFYEDQSKYFDSHNLENSWIYFEFKNHTIIPFDYIIRSINSWNQNDDHPQNWVIEGSKDKNEWEVLYEIQNSNYLNGKSLIINNSNFIYY